MTMKTIHNCCTAFRGLKYFRYYFICGFLFLITVLFMTCYPRNHPTQCSSNNLIVEALSSLPVVKIYGIKEEEKTLDVVKTMFTNIGYEIKMSDGSTNDWNVLWSHTYPFYSLRNEILHLKYYQKVNHFPGSGYITQKNNLASLPVKNIPKSFLLPAQRTAFTEYAAENMNVFWMIKNSNHRGIRILNGTENLDEEGTFVQEFIKDPLLINGKKFDIGVYVMLTSVDPLRVYVYSGDILLRFCKENYFPLNINSVASYVVSDDYLPIWEIPDLKNYFTELNYTAKESLNAYLHSKGKGTKFLHLQILRTIQDVYFSAEEDLKRSSMAFGNLRNFFELVRFDFIADEYLNVYLLEVNMSPNLSPAHFPQNRLLYDQIIFSSLQLVGLVRKFRVLHGREAEVSEKDIQVNSEQCGSPACEKSCNVLKCKICNRCLDGELRDVFKSAYVEYLNRGKFQRAIPVPANQKNGDSLKIPAKLSPMNAYMEMWFRGKCLQDASWC